MARTAGRSGDQARAAAAWAALLAGCAGVFTAPSSAIFADLATGWALCPGRRTITRIITIVDPEGRRAHDAYHQFVRAGRWSLTALWRALTLAIVAALCPTGVVALDLDDTLYHKTGRRIVGAGSFRDAVRSTRRRVVYAHGLNLVVLTLRVTPPSILSPGAASLWPASRPARLPQGRAHPRRARRGDDRPGRRLAGRPDVHAGL